MEPDTALKRAELRRFVHELAGELEASAGTFDDLIIVAGPRMLGEIRQALTDRVAATVRKEIGKDLAGLDVPTLTVELAPTCGSSACARSLPQPSAPMARRRANTSGGPSDRGTRAQSLGRRQRSVVSSDIVVISMPLPPCDAAGQETLKRTREQFFHFRASK